MYYFAITRKWFQFHFRREKKAAQINLNSQFLLFFPSVCALDWAKIKTLTLNYITRVPELYLVSFYFCWPNMARETIIHSTSNRLSCRCQPNKGNYIPSILVELFRTQKRKKWHGLRCSGSGSGRERRHRFCVKFAFIVFCPCAIESARLKWATDTLSKWRNQRCIRQHK